MRPAIRPPVPAEFGVTVPDHLFEIDHVIPVRWGGRSNLSNLVGACWMCNGEKGQEAGWEPYSPAWQFATGLIAPRKRATALVKVA